ncbi:MAG: hypothetical protein HY302_04930 [Opitutae bacterium]|nr:hypothetical protein [Opitutae bacterium]
MNQQPAPPEPDDFRVVDLFSPGDGVFGRPAPTGATISDPSRMATADMPASFMFTNPLFERSGPERETKPD